MSTAEAVSPRRTRCLRSAWIEGSDFCVDEAWVCATSFEFTITHFVQSVGECVLATRRGSEDLPVIDHKLVSTRCRLALGNSLERTDNLDRRFKCECESLVGLRDLTCEDTLEVAGTIPEDDEDDLLLVAETMHPSGCPDAF